MKGALVKLRMNSPGVVQTLQAPGVAADLANRGQRIASSLPRTDGEEWAVSSFMGRDRAQTIVRTGNTAAKRAAAEDLALIRALDAGR